MQNDPQHTKKIRILLADDHEVVRRGLALVLRQEPDFEVVGEAENGAEAVSLAINLAPDLALLDWKMPQMDGLETAREIKKNVASVQTIILSGAAVVVRQLSATAVLDALDDGVDGFVHKDISPRQLAHAIRVVASGKTYLGPEVTQALISRSQPANQPPPALSSRETEVLNLMATPATYREIGEQLYISEETVRTYAKRIFSKLAQPNRTQAVIMAIRVGLITID